jgi:serine/threonine kinase 38
MKSKEAYSKRTLEMAQLAKQYI